jgi:hypothetical protein
MMLTGTDEESTKYRAYAKRSFFHLPTYFLITSPAFVCQLVCYTEYSTCDIQLPLFWSAVAKQVYVDFL